MARPHHIGTKRDLSVWLVPKVNTAKAAALGVQTRNNGFHGLVYVGSSDALRACGVIPKGLALPGEDGSGRKMSRTVSLTNGQVFGVGRHKDTFFVSIGPSNADRRRLEDEDEKRRKARQADERELADLRRQIDEWPRSAADLKRRALEVTWRKLNAVLTFLTREGRGIDDEYLEDIREACHELYWQIDAAQFHVDLRKLRELALESSRRDSQFQGFLSTVFALSKPKRTKAKQ